MKKLIISTILSLVSATALASQEYTRCDLENLSTSADEVEVLKEKYVKLGTDVTRLQSYLIMETARWVSERSGNDYEVSDLTDAINVLLGNSSYNDIVVKTLRIDGQIFTAVVHFPGDNEYGLLFEGSKRAIEIHDGDFYCQKHL